MLTPTQRYASYKNIQLAPMAIPEMPKNKKSFFFFCEGETVAGYQKNGDEQQAAYQCSQKYDFVTVHLDLTGDDAV